MMSMLFTFYLALFLPKFLTSYSCVDVLLVLKISYLSLAVLINHRNHLNLNFLTKCIKKWKVRSLQEPSFLNCFGWRVQVEGFQLQYNKQKTVGCAHGEEGTNQFSQTNINTKGASQLLQKLLFDILFINVVHASNICDMQLVISRKRTHAETTPQPTRQLDNPYVFKPKSYSTKRNVNQDITEKIPRSSPSKKLKKDVLGFKESLSNLLINMNQISIQIQKSTQNYFSQQFFSSNKLQEDKASSTLLGNQENVWQKKLNPMMKNQITIVSNKNEKIPTLIHQGLLLANTTHTKIGKEQYFLKGVSNPFDVQKRNHYLKTIKFQKDYKSGYAPIQMQQKNKQEPEEKENQNQGSKTHFIRKKQSTLSLPRSCGVSYIKPSQSFQVAPFQPLPPLIFQCSSTCADPKLMKEKFDNISNIFNSMTQSCWIPYIHCTQDEMRDLLLGKRIGVVGWVKGVQNIWPLFSEGSFLLLIYSNKRSLTEQQVWKAYGQTPFKIGILAKKSTSGKKAFLKSLNIKQAKNQEQSKQDKNNVNDEKLNVNDNLTQKLSTENINHIPQEHKNSSLEEDIANQLKDCRTVITLSLRLQMYVEEHQWKSLPKQTKDMLNYLITNLKDTVEKGSLQIIKKRLNLAKMDQKQIITQQLVKKIRIPKNKSHFIQTQKLLHSNIVMSQQQLISMFNNYSETQKQFEQELQAKTQTITFENILKCNKTQSSLQKTLKMPLYYISTRDSFAFDLIQKTSYLVRQNGRKFKKIQYYFDPDNLPSNYGRQYKQRFANLDVGITSYHDFFANQQLNQFQANTFGTEVDAFKNKFLQMTVQPSIVGTKIKRTKFFFGYRYMWTRCQLAQPGSYVGAGVRRDVTAPPKWTQKIINAFVNNSIAPKDFINSIAINVYHDGKQGLAQHFDDAVRFRQPIFTVRLFSDARLSFGSQFYGFCNGAFIIPLPRGCICVMEQNSYAANGVKHCVRPCDMTGKSAAVILRQMHHKVVSQAQKYDQMIDFPSWVSCLSSSPDAVTFGQQKRRQAQHCANYPKQQLGK